MENSKIELAIYAAVGMSLLGGVSALNMGGISDIAHGMFVVACLAIPAAVIFKIAK
jgi:hypothetical protein